MTLRVEEVGNDNKNEWEAYINQRNDTTFVDSWAWREVLEKVYRFRHYWYVAKDNGNIKGALALTLTRHPIFGNYLVSAPFASQGGFYADSAYTAQTLLEKATEILRGLRAGYVNVRQFDGEMPLTGEWQLVVLYATYQMYLGTDPDRFIKEHLRSKTRNEVSKALKNRLKIKFGMLNLFEDFWYVISRSMKELGSPYHSKKYLETILDKFGNRAEFAVAYCETGEPIGGSLLMHHCDTTTLLHANILRKHRNKYAGEFLYWSVIAECCRRGIRCFDMGRSLIGSKNEHFKMKWRPIRQPLAYWYHLAPGIPLPSLNQANPKFQLAIKMWQRLPLWIHRVIGPHLISGIL